MSMKPLIGITMNLEEQTARNVNLLDQSYGAAVLRAGGIPVPILGIEGSIPDLVARIDGFLFTGGDDIHPRFYQERPLAGAGLRLASDHRVRFELNLFKAVAKARKPVLAVCYGAQLVNVALGGTLYQDIERQVPQAIKHGPAGPNDIVHHRVTILEGTRLCSIMGSVARRDPVIRVRSAHHQSVKNPGRGLRLAAVSADGVFEALESRGRAFLIAVQWHPEKTPAERSTRNLFDALVAASRRTSLR
jgi:putative glutamine amidotransferase